MKTNKHHIYSFALFFLIIALWIYGCENIELNSNWLDRKIIIDGIDTDWKNSMIFLENSKVAIGMFNDENYLYLAITLWDTRIQNQIINNGLIVWFDPNKNYDKDFGISYPLKLEDQEFPIVHIGNRKESEKSLEQFKKLQTNLEVIYPGENEPVRMNFADAESLEINAGIGNSGGRLFYELKVPIEKDSTNKFARNLNSKNSINIGFETPEVLIETSKEYDTEEYTKVVSGSGMIRRRNSTNDNEKRIQRSSLLHDNLEVWATVTLSQKPVGRR